MANPKPHAIPTASISLALLAIIFCASPGLDAGMVPTWIYNLSGNSVASLTNHPAFPSQPAAVEVWSRGLEKNGNGTINYGSFTRGYIEAPQSGRYTFWIASDDDSAFCLSTNHEVANLQRVCDNTGHVPVRIYSMKPQQRSDEIPLIKGEKYYFELLMKQGVGADHVSVSWTLPDGTMERPIPAKLLWPFPGNAEQVSTEKAPELVTEFMGKPVQGLGTATAIEGGVAEFAASASASQPATVQWYCNERLIPGANLLSLVVTNTQMENDVDIYTIVVSNALGTARANAVLSVRPDSEPLHVKSVLNLGTDQLAVLFSTAVDTATASRTEIYSLDNGAVVRKASRGLNNSVVLLETSSLADGRKYTLKVRQARKASRTAQEVRDLSATVEQELQTWLKFDSVAANDVAPDATGLAPATLHKGARIDARGRIGGALYLDGKEAYASLPEGFKDFSNGLTIALWARPAARTRWGRFVDLGNGQQLDNVLLARHMISDGLDFEAFDPENVHQRASSWRGLELDKWQHVAVVADKDGASLYADGELLETRSIPLPKTVLRKSNLVGKSNWTVDRTYAGWMDDLRIYTRPLSATEIQVLSKAVPAPGADGPELISAFDIGISNLVALVFSKALDPASAAVRENYRVDGLPVLAAQVDPSGRSVFLTVPGLRSGTRHDVAVNRVKDTQGNAVQTGGSVALDHGLKLWLKFDEVSGMETPDGSGNGFSATLHDGAALAESFIDGKAMMFEGSAHLQLPEGFDNFTDGMTVMLWVCPGKPGFWSRFVDFGNGPATENILFARPAATANVAFETYRTGSNLSTGVHAGGVLQEDEWQHLAASFDASGNAAIYKNGVLLQQGECGVPDRVIRTKNYIGRSNWDADDYYQGRMDDLRVYNRALSATEIAAIVHAIAPSR